MSEAKNARMKSSFSVLFLYPNFLTWQENGKQNRYWGLDYETEQEQPEEAKTGENSGMAMVEAKAAYTLAGKTGTP